MHRKKLKGPSSLVNKRFLRSVRDDLDSNNSNSNSNTTDSFDMNDFKSSSLTKKYSVQIHKNNADLMAELNSINIMGDESDIEIIEQPKADQNGLSASNESKATCLNSTHSNDDRPNGEYESDKHERILAWAQSQSQNLSMCVASVLSDHDYLSQELLLGIIAGNENSELEKREAENIIMSVKTTNTETNGTAESTTHSSNDNSLNIDDLTAILNQLHSSKDRAQRLTLLEQIETKTKQLKAQLNGDEIKSDNNTPDFSPNHSEPLEYYGGIKFSAQSSVDDAKESEGKESEVVLELRSELKAVDDIASRVSIDATSIRTKLKDIEGQSEEERSQTIGKLRENLALLVENMADELTKMALKLNPSKVENEPTLKTKKSRSPSDSSDENSDKSESRRKLRKLKRRRKRRPSSTDLSSDSEDFVDKSTKKEAFVKDEPFVISQNFDELLNGATSNSANGSIRKENDFLGFDNEDDDIEIGIKTELNDTFPSQVPTSEKDESRSIIEPKDNVDSNASAETNNQNKDPAVLEGEQFASEHSAIDGATENMEVDADRSSSVASLSDDNDLMDDDDNDDDDDDDDEDIRKLLDFSSLGSKRIASTHAAAKVNGIVEPKKPEPKKKPPKEDGLQKILNDSLEDGEKPAESEEEKSEQIEEYTEEHFLKEQNDQCKEQLLLTSDSEMGSDDDRRINGNGSDLDSDLESDRSSNSNESLLGKFLADESKESGRKKEEKSKENKASVSPEKQSKIKEPSQNKKSAQKIERFDEELDSDIEFDPSDSESVPEPPKKSKSTVGKNVFSNIEKDKHIVIPSDEDDISGSESKKKSTNDKRKSEVDSSENNSEVLDTTMFKSSKKVVSQNQLSRILQSKQNHKQSTSRISPECISVSSDDDQFEIESTSTEKKNGNDDDEGEEKEKRNTRKLLRHDQLADDTKLAQKEESDRIKRLDKKNERLTQFMESQRLSQSQSESQHGIDPNEVVLDVDSKKNEKIVVHAEITKHLKAHQVEGIKFMYDCCYGSVDNLDKYPGSGCILAHCMGLGKTLQLITLLHTVICYPQLKTDKVLVICPKSTVMNWKEEIERWLGNIKHTRKLKLFHFPEASDINAKLTIMRDWSQCGKDGNKQAGCLLLGYEAFRVLVFYHNSKKSQSLYSDNELERMRKSIHKYLLDPGADLVVCDEGHMIKNQKSTTSAAVNKIKTRRRIVLTGTPIQNNLKEYYSMVNFIKPSFLGTEKEFANLYVNPIKNGQHKDSSKSEIKYMKQRSYVLHKKLSRFVQRKEAALLKSFLPEKYEFVLFIPMTKIQTDLYEFFLENRPNQDQKGKSLIPDYTVLRKIWTHPKVLENAYLNAIQNKTKVKPPPTLVPANDNSDDDQPDDVFDSQTGQMSVTSDWWRSHLTKEDLETILPSNKLKILFEILNQCRRNKEKCLIFSAFVAVLDVVEFFMRLINDQEKNGNKPGLESFRGPWELGKDYYRLDGKTAKNHRHSMITNFNDPKNERTRAFLISAKAGGQGINLIGANRVVLLDTSWNPSNDQQNIFRVFRLGQKRICYIYRLLSMGTMEEKVYSRSVTKQAMSCRVVDEQQIDRHYNMTDLTDLYTLTKPNMSERPTPNVPKDDLLAHLLINFSEMVYKYHEHDSLLENKGEEELSEQEKNDAWAAYEADVKRKNETNMGPYSNNFGGMLPNYSGLGQYANSLFSNYNNLSGLNYPYNMSNMYGSYNPYTSDLMRFDNYSQFYNNLMNVAGTSMTNYNPNNSSLMSPNHSSSASSPSPIMNMNNFSSSSSSSRNWMQPSNASSSNYANNLLSSLAQSSSSSKNSYSSYLNSLYNALGTNNPSTAAAAAAAAAAVSGASTSKSPPFPMPGTDFNPLSAYLQKEHLSNLAASSNPISSTTSMPGSSSAQQGPNALRNPITSSLLTKEVSIPRNPSIANQPKEMFNPIPTPVITKSATGTSPSLSAISPGSSNQSDASKSSSKSPDISSSVDKTAKPSKTTADSLLKNATNNVNNSKESRDSPDTTVTKRMPSKNTIPVSNGVSSSVDSTKKTNKGSTTLTPISSNMGIVYPPQKPIEVASTSKASSSATVLMPVNDKAKDKPPHNSMSNAAPVLNKAPSQPMPAIIRKPPQQSAVRSTDPTNDAVAAINKNKALTVTQRSITSPTAKVGPVAGVNNSITLSPIPNSTAAKFSGSGLTITPQVSQTKLSTPTQSRTLSPHSKTNSSSPIPIAITKVSANQTTTKSPTPQTKPNVLSSRNTNTTKIISVPKTSNAVSPIPTTVRVLSSNQSVSPKIIGQQTQGFKPIIAQTKAHVQASQMANRSVNNSGVQINRVLTSVKPTQKPADPSSIARPKIIANRANTSITTIDARKRSANEPINNSEPKRLKRLKPLNSNLIASGSTPRLSPKPANALAGIRISRPVSQQPVNTQKVNSQIAVPVEIVELD